MSDLLKDRYRLLSRLGQGGMGIVYRAQDLRLEREVAVKLLPPLPGESALARFALEARALGKLNHPNIVTLYDFDDVDGRPFLVMELLDGLDLSRVGLLAIDEVLRIGLCIADALAYAHQQGVIHRDVKPSNIHRLADGRVKLVDLGLASIAGQARMTLSDRVVGTPHYAAPEQAMGKPADGRSDLYSLAVVLYELLAGVPPFGGCEFWVILNAKLNGSPQSVQGARPEAPATLDDLLRRALRPDPTDRFQTAHELRAALAEVAARLGEAPPRAVEAADVDALLQRMAKDLPLPAASVLAGQPEPAEAQSWATVTVPDSRQTGTATSPAVAVSQAGRRPQVAPTPLVSDTLRQRRRARFVGRQGELALFGRALSEPEWPFQVLGVHGPGGIGKTTLLQQYAALAGDRGLPFVLVEGRHVEASPEGFGRAVTRAAQAQAGGELTDLGRGGGVRWVLAIDTYESLLALDCWIREGFAPDLPRSCLLLLVGRKPLSTAWRVDPGWTDMVMSFELAALTPAESRELLCRRQVAAAKQDALVRLARGHPLALALAADTCGEEASGELRLTQAPHLVTQLLERFLEGVPTPTHRAALELAAILRVTSEPLLAALVEADDPHALLQWLRGLSFIQTGPRGSYPHDLAREAIESDLQLRNRERHEQLQRAAFQQVAGLFARARAEDQHDLVTDLLYLQRHHPIVRPHFEWDAEVSGWVERARPVDIAPVLAMVERYEGSAARDRCARCIAAQPETLFVSRERPGEVSGFMLEMWIDLAWDRGRLVPDDPVMAAALRHLDAHVPLAPGERVLVIRNWMSSAGYQTVDLAQSLLFVHGLRTYMGTPDMVFSFITFADGDFWQAIAGYARLRRLADLDVTVGGWPYGFFGHDWRDEPPAVWLKHIAENAFAPVGG